MGPVTIQATNELVDLFFRESGRMGVRGAIEALLERVNAEIKRYYVPRWGTVRISVCSDFPTSPTYDKLMEYYKRSAVADAVLLGGTIPDPDDFEILNPVGDFAWIEWKMRRND